MTSDISRLTNLYRYHQSVRGVKGNILSTKEVVDRVTFRISKGLKKAVSVSIAPVVDILIRN